MEITQTLCYSVRFGNSYCAFQHCSHCITVLNLINVNPSFHISWVTRVTFHQYFKVRSLMWLSAMYTGQSEVYLPKNISMHICMSRKPFSDMSTRFWQVTNKIWHASGQTNNCLHSHAHTVPCHANGVSMYWAAMLCHCFVHHFTDTLIGLWRHWAWLRRGYWRYSSLFVWLIDWYTATLPYC